MKETIIIGGIEYIRKDAVKNQKNISLTGYERAKKNTSYWEGYSGNVHVDREEYTNIDADSYQSGNYYTSECIAENNARADVIMFRLRQWQALNDDVVDWNNKYIPKWYIAYSYSDNYLCTYTMGYYRAANMIYFSTEEKAKEAIKIFHDDLIWYFTRYQQRLDQ